MDPPPVRGVNANKLKTNVSKEGNSSLTVSKQRAEQEAKEREAKLVRNSPSIFRKDPGIKFEFDYYFEDLQVLNDVSFGQRNYYRNLDVLLERMMKEWETRKK